MMFRNFMIATAAVVAMSGSAMAEGVAVEAINVKADLSSIKNPDAAKFYATLPQDLTAAITKHLTDGEMVNSGGSKVTIDIDALQLASTWQTVTDLSKSELKGTVSQTSDSDNSKFNNYTLTVGYNSIIALLPPGTDTTVLMKDSAKYYHAMVDTFASEVVKELK